MERKDVLVIIDPGHGGISPSTNQYVTKGKRSPVWEDGKQYFEGVGNRFIAECVGQLLESVGIRFRYTVAPDNWKDVPLWKRVGLANQWAAEEENVFLISIHSNGFKKESANGAEVWTWPGQSPADPMATIWMEEHTNLFPELRIRSDKSDGDVDKESKFKINSVNCPSFLIESMFHTNEEECRILMSDKGKLKVATGIFNAVTRIIKELY